VFREPQDRLDSQRQAALRRRVAGADDADASEKLEAAKRIRARFL
jgi:hypothetical protein